MTSMTDSLQLHTVSPLLHSLPLSRRLGKPVYLKLEALQPCGSFKIRGIGRLCTLAKHLGARRIVSSSGGNAGVAAAYAGQHLGLPVTVYVFDGVPETAVQRMQEYGAEVVPAGPTWQQAHEAATELAQSAQAFYVHPFDHPEIWAGHASLVDELVVQGPRPDLMVLAVGGGGLLAGVLAGLDNHDLGQTPVLAVETTGTASFAAAKAAGHPVRLARIDSIAKTLGAAQIADEAFARAARHDVASWVVSDAQALAACRQFALDHRLLVEPAAGAALAALYDGSPAVAQAQSVHVVVCGGVGVALKPEIFDFPSPAAS